MGFEAFGLLSIAFSKRRLAFE